MERNESRSFGSGMGKNKVENLDRGWRGKK